MIDVRFPTALQMLLSLALAEKNGLVPVNSADLARSLGASPSFARKMLVPLTRAGLVESSMGQTGGTRLARPAHEISLREVYEAVIGNKPLWSPRDGIPSVCMVSSNVGTYFATISAAAEDAALANLATATLADGLAELRKLDSRRRVRTPKPRSAAKDARRAP